VITPGLRRPASPVRRCIHSHPADLAPSRGIGATRCASCRHERPPPVTGRPSDRFEGAPGRPEGSFPGSRYRLRRQVMYSGLKTEWVVLGRGSDGRCEMRTGFLLFDAEAPMAAIRRYLAGVSAPAELNEAARMAMFRPWWRGTTSEPGACADYVARTTPMAGQLLAAFRTYAPRNRSDKERASADLVDVLLLAEARPEGPPIAPRRLRRSVPLPSPGPSRTSDSVPTDDGPGAPFSQPRANDLRPDSAAGLGVESGWLPLEHFRYPVSGRATVRPDQRAGRG